MEAKRKFGEELAIEEEGESKRLRNFTLTLKSSLVAEENKKLTFECWNERNASAPSDVEVMSEPFKCCVVKDLVEDTTVLEELQEQLECLDLMEKNNDLYQFRQSQDLANFDMPAINNLKKFLIEDCRIWIQEVTGIELSTKLSVTYSCYTDTDYLLCHDDKCEDRRIAFILYLTEEWYESFGGALQLFDTDNNGRPMAIARSVLPEFNKFVFFEVTDKSFHQVAEVLTGEKTRVTVNGWFHSSVQCSKNRILEPMPPKVFPTPLSDSDILAKYINPVYIQNGYQSQVSHVFEEESQLSLVNFLKQDIFKSLSESLADANIQWQKQGPANRRCFFVPIQSTVPSLVKEFVEFFTSDAVFTFLHQLTNLDLTTRGEINGSTGVSSSREDPSRNPYCSVEIIKWEKGCYTLVNDDDSTFKESALDAVLFFNTDEFEEEYGGFTSYIARDEDLELLTVTPTENALALSYRDEQTMRFVKYINHHFEGEFYSINFVFRE